MSVYALTILNIVSAAPKTGDHSHTALYIILAVVAAAAIAGLLFFAKKKK